MMMGTKYLLTPSSFYKCIFEAIVKIFDNVVKYIDKSKQEGAY